MSKHTTQPTPTIVITGASGLLGTQLVQYFAAQGWRVRALVRDPATQSPRQHVTYLAYDMTSPPADSLLTGADYLVHAAYIKESKLGPDAFTANVQAAEQLIKLAKKHKLRRSIFMSSMSADEHAPATYGRQKAATEKLFQGKQATVIRSGLIIGDGGLIKQIVSFMRSKHVAPLIDGGNQPLQVIAVDDMIQAIEAIIAKQVSGTLLIGTPEVYSYREFYLLIRQKLHITAAIIPVPFWIPLLVIRTINLLHLPLGVTEDNLQGLKRLRAFDTLPSLAKLGIRPKTLDRILDDMIG